MHHQAPQTKLMWRDALQLALGKLPNLAGRSLKGGEFQ